MPLRLLAQRLLALRHTPRQAYVSNRRCSRISCMATQPSTATVCVHAPTAVEGQAAAQALQAALPLICQRATADQPELHCSLQFPGSSTQDGSEACGSFRPQEFFSSLRSASLGRVLLTAAATNSTQVVVQENVVKLPDGLVFVADKQLGGKGRGGNRWESPDGCLMFSACKRLSIPGQRLPFVQYIVSLAVVQAVQAETQRRLQGGSIDVRIKWPNDIYAGPLKLGGILCHSSFRDKQFYVIMGVGLNLANRQPTTCIDALIEQAAAAAVGAGAAADGGIAGEGQQQEQHGQQQQPQPQAATTTQGQGQGQLEPVSRESLLAGILSRLEPMLEQLAADGFEPFEKEYCTHWLHSNQQVQLEEGKQLIPITIQGLSPSGYLLATDASGERYELHPDGNSLDFFRGLVRKKLPQ